MPHLLALDQGTSSSRSIVFNEHGHIVAMAQRELPQIYPHSGWVEHNPHDIWRTQIDTAREALQRAGLRGCDIAGIGISNQRETTLLWHRHTGVPLCNAIVWQDRRTHALCKQWRQQGWEPAVQERTGLRLDPYFSATKLHWMLQQVPQARSLAERGELAFGTVDSWLLWNLTGGHTHATDVSNASRTLLFDIHRQTWDTELLEAWDLPPTLLPQVLPSSAAFGYTRPECLGHPIPIGGVAGDQQSALFGQACFEPGLAKNTYGTGCFLLLHTGEHFLRSHNGLLTTAAVQAAPRPQFALEGSVFVGGAVVQWLRDGLRAVASSQQAQTLADSVPDSGGVLFVPAFTGLGAPYWDPAARGAIVGLSRGSTVAHIARAAIESIAFQSAAVLQAMDRDAVAAGGTPLRELRVDGGASVNDGLMQFQADLLGIPVLRPAVTETTAWGAACLAGLQVGVFSGLDDVRQRWRAQRTFSPQGTRSQAQERMAQWEHAVRQARAL